MVSSVSHLHRVYFSPYGIQKLLSIVEAEVEAIQCRFEHLTIPQEANAAINMRA